MKYKISALVNGPLLAIVNHVEVDNIDLPTHGVRESNQHVHSLEEFSHVGARKKQREKRQYALTDAKIY